MLTFSLDLQALPHDADAAVVAAAAAAVRLSSAQKLCRIQSRHVAPAAWPQLSQLLTAASNAAAAIGCHGYVHFRNTLPPATALRCLDSSQLPRSSLLGGPVAEAIEFAAASRRLRLPRPCAAHTPVAPPGFVPR